jgi:hypothetical protein
MPDNPTASDTQADPSDATYDAGVGERFAVRPSLVDIVSR